MTAPFEPLVLLCPGCGRQHIDEGERATTPHVEHECDCGHRWRPRKHATVGIPLGTLSEGWLFDVAVVHGEAAEDAIRQAWAGREGVFAGAIPVLRAYAVGPAPMKPGPFREVGEASFDVRLGPATTWGGRA